MNCAREPPKENNLGWKRKVHIFTSKGTERIDVRVFEWPDGQPCEVFLSTAKSGSTTDQYMRSVGKMVSRLLQYGMPVEELVRKLAGEVGPLAGQTDDPDIPHVTGFEDLLSQILAKRYKHAVPTVQ